MSRDWLDAALRSWHALGYELRYGIWLGVGLLVLAVMLISSYYLLRRLAGHHKFRGTWYSASQFAQLLNMLREDHRKGHRVMRPDELKLLRHEMFGAGFKPLFRGKHGGYM